MKEELNVVEIHKEIDLIQSCINRMAQNSFMTKGWLISLYVIALALLPETIDMFLVCAVLFMFTISFWYLDAFFLRTERIYRKIYDWVLKERTKNNRDLLYGLNPEQFKDKIEETKSNFHIMWSKTLLCFYAIPLALIVVLALIKQ